MHIFFRAFFLVGTYVICGGVSAFFREGSNAIACNENHMYLIFYLVIDLNF